MGKTLYRIKCKYIYTLIILVTIFAGDIEAGTRTECLALNEKGIFFAEIPQDTLQDIVTGADLEKILRYVSIKMSRMQLTGNPDYDFAILMTEHIKASINLANIEMREGKDSLLKDMANIIIERKKSEMDNLKSIIDQIKRENLEVENGSVTGSSREDLDKGFLENESNMPEPELTDNLDYDFATLMIRHNQSAIDLCSRFLDQAEMDQTRKIARKMINQNSREIKQILKWKDEIRSER